MSGSKVVLAAALAAVVGSWGCASRPAAVPVLGDPSDLRALAGEWEGEYSSQETGRSGSIVFTLRAGRDSAAGDVVMTPATPPTPAVRSEGNVALPSGASAAAQVLTITFVRAAGDSVSGALAPYTSPDCACSLTTTFVGRVRGDAIEGTFTTRGEGVPGPQPGRWKVTRKRR
jgi:hypothetical protein